MVKSVRVITMALGFSILLSLTVWGGQTSTAQEEEPPKRQTTIVVSTTEIEWWMVRWAGDFVVCQIFVDHEGVPTGEDILADCGQKLYQEWKSTPPCKAAEREAEPGDKNGKDKLTFRCFGVYFLRIGSQTGEKTMLVDIPPPSVTLTLARCTPKLPENLCQQLPSLLLTGEEPLPNERITAIHAIADGTPYTCEAEICEIPLQPTRLPGIEVEFWAESSFGDSSEHFTAKVRVLDSGVARGPVEGGWFVDVLSSQWRGAPVESCALVWEAFPPIGGPPFWLSSPTQEQILASAEPFYYLAGRLIDHGLVDAQVCPGNGLLTNGYANACGLDQARPMVDLWQNQFDGPIIEAAEEFSLPAQLMKNLFAQESQFWPGVFRVASEYGLGQLTDMGADTILLWNPSFFNQFCPMVLEESVCDRGYLRLQENERAILRGALAVAVNADCPECLSGIDLTNANFSVTLFAQSLLANCGQVARTVFNATNDSPGSVSNYEDLWRFTLANYHAGPGCTAFAIHTASQRGEILNWGNVSTHFTAACQSAIPYVELIAQE